MQTLKKDFSDGMLQVKIDKSAKQEADLESRQRVEMADLWLQVKKEIKEEMKRNLKPSSLVEVIMKAVVKKEVKQEHHQDLPSYHSEVFPKDRIPQDSKFATGPIAKPEPTPVAKRRRLSRDIQGRMQTDDPSSAKKEFDGVKVKTDRSAEQQTELEIDDVWRQVKKEIDREASAEAGEPDRWVKRAFTLTNQISLRQWIDIT